MELAKLLDQSLSLYFAGLGTVILALVISTAGGDLELRVATRIAPLRDAVISLVACIVMIFALGKVGGSGVLPTVASISPDAYIAVLRTIVGAVFLFFGLRLADALEFAKR